MNRLYIIVILVLFTILLSNDINYTTESTKAIMTIDSLKLELKDYKERDSINKVHMKTCALISQDQIYFQNGIRKVKHVRYLAERTKIMSEPQVGFELPDYEEYINDYCLEDNENSKQQYDEYIEELKSEYNEN